MRKPGRFVGWLSAAVLLGWGLSWAIPRIPGALDDLDWFRVRSLRVEGLRYLRTEEVKLTAAVPKDSNLLTYPTGRFTVHPDLLAGGGLPGDG